MAIDDHPDVRCWSTRHDPSQAPVAAAMVREVNAHVNAWSSRCQPCIDQLAVLQGTHVLVAYLDPARQRRPDPDGWTEHHLDKYGRVVPNDYLAP